ncbi:hypothetical protein GNI_134190 [Gregarina niphandrodes]|uniref:Uncharacterized protein n=1 Tax=Gregarina niphandrodes TaxID=110365 RepID=A0A023B0Z9_GRENI|nr:hypothetical protein GNI_134190 [Gregarina niphandrodes]EZG46245.1 hypothetical protein GNI_134190 [Gregarina niphandrodes]|eukprot:XP_011132315.1 hypothetical protein GNI_134190 [Gregarina niphandrodes]
MEQALLDLQIAVHRLHHSHGQLAHFASEALPDARFPFYGNITPHVDNVDRRTILFLSQIRDSAEKSDKQGGAFVQLSGSNVDNEQIDQSIYDSQPLRTPTGEQIYVGAQVRGTEFSLPPPLYDPLDFLAPPDDSEIVQIENYANQLLDKLQTG